MNSRLSEIVIEIEDARATLFSTVGVFIFLIVKMSPGRATWLWFHRV